MISRYNRRPVSNKLEIRGLSRSSLDQHPLPEEVDDNQTPQHYVHIHNSSETSAASGHSDCPTVISVDSHRPWSGIHSATGTGISTERSSVFSWGYDEFDTAASRQVQQMFEELDKELYEGEGSGSGILQGLQDECQQWGTQFPHLRILGTQLVCPSDEGFQWYSTSGTGSSTGTSAGKRSSLRSQDDENDNRQLNVQGKGATLVPPSSVDVPPGRVFEVDGLIEEYLAFDSIDLDDERRQDCSQSDGRRRCMPPVSPYRCRQQAIVDLLFDGVWQQLVVWMRGLLHRHWESCSSSNRRVAESSSPVQRDAHSPFMLLSALPMMLPRLDQSRLPTLTAGVHFQGTKSRGSEHQSRQKPRTQRRPSATGRVPVGTAAAAAQHDLNDLIVIHSIPLQQRSLGVPDRSQEPDERTPLRPGSPVVPSGRPRPRRALEQSSSSLSRPPQSARRRNPPPRTLLPLVPGLSQSSAAGSLDEVIRGTRLPTATDRLTSPSLPLSRNTLLPPISTGDAEGPQSGPQPKPAQQRQKGPPSRAPSAINDEVGGSMPRDRHHLLDILSRPNTTHTYRSDTPYRRSFTVLDTIGQGRPGRASVGTDFGGIGVTGTSLGISSSSFLDSFSHHPLGHLPIRDEEEPVPAPLGPASVPPRAHPRGVISSRASRPGL